MKRLGVTLKNIACTHNRALRGYKSLGRNENIKTKVTKDYESWCKCNLCQWYEKKQ